MNVQVATLLAQVDQGRGGGFIAPLVMLVLVVIVLAGYWQVFVKAGRNRSRPGSVLWEKLIWT